MSVQKITFPAVELFRYFQDTYGHHKKMHNQNQFFRFEELAQELQVNVSKNSKKIKENVATVKKSNLLIFCQFEGLGK